jgi:tripeptide aminopeptidase
MARPKVQHSVEKRFLKYITFDTQSSEESTRFPSTAKQKKLGKALTRELKSMGLANAELDKNGYVLATLEANTEDAIPIIGLIAHMDTSPDVSGANVKAVIHQNYQGGPLVLPGDPHQVLLPGENPALSEQIGHDIITSDGTTLLGADNKAGIAEIFEAVQYFVDHPEIKHGRIQIAITPDEEIGMGTKYFDIKKFGAAYAYTIDGETAGEIEDETFCADSLSVTFAGVNVHPGYAKGRLVNAIKIAADFIEQLPKNALSPETTEKREGYVHPHLFQGTVESVTLKFLVRDFTIEGLKEKEDYLQRLAREVVAKYPKATVEVSIDEFYRNMKYMIDKDPKVVDYAVEAIRRAGMNPIRGSIRGGTDGARLSFDGLLTPNIFTGGHNFHSKHEWISIQDMRHAVDVIIQLIQVWAEKK